MDYEHAFVQQVRANPQDVTARLVFADYLEDIGDMRCELIRVQVELAALPPGDPARRELELRETELLDRYGDEWIAPLKALGAEGVSSRCFQRGLIERVRISARAFMEHGEELCRQAPALYRLELRRASELEEPFLDRLPPQITALDLSANRLDPRHSLELFLPSWFQQLTFLSLAFNQLSDEDARGHFTFVASRALARLDLSVNKLTEHGINALGQRAALPGLASLQLSVNPLGNEGLAALARSPLAQSLKELDLGRTRITAAGVIALANTPLLANIESLLLRGNVLGEHAPRAFDVLATAPRLKHLDVRGTVTTVAQYGYGAASQGPPQVLSDRFGDRLVW